MIKHFVEIVNTLNKVSLLPITVTEDGKKIPRLSSWKQYQTQLPTEEEYKSWLSQGLFNEGIAAVCGKSPVDANLHLIVLDADTPAAVKLLSKLTASHKTRKERTKKGLHVFYFVKDIPPNTKIRKNHYSKDGTIKIDILSNGCYCVTHPTKGYELIDEDVKAPLIISYAELVALTQAIDDEIAKQNQQHEIIEKISPHYQCGNRHNICFALAGYLRKNRGFTKADASKLIETLASMNGDEEIEDRLRCVEDTYARELDEIAGVSALRELGIELQGEAEASPEASPKSYSTKNKGLVHEKDNKVYFAPFRAHKIKIPSTYDAVPAGDDIDKVKRKIKGDKYIEGIFLNNQINFIFGDGAVGKTNLVVNIVYHYLKNNPNAKCLYIDNDDALQAPVFGLLKEFQKEKRFKHFSYAGTPKFIEDGAMYGYIEKEFLDEAIVVYDTLTNMIDGDISKTEDISPYLNMFQRFLNYGATVIAIGHTTKETESGFSTFRGSGLIKSNVHCIIQAERLEDDEEEDNGQSCIELTYLKNRGDGERKRRNKIKYCYFTKTEIEGGFYYKLDETCLKEDVKPAPKESLADKIWHDWLNKPLTFELKLSKDEFWGYKSILDCLLKQPDLTMIKGDLFKNFNYPKKHYNDKNEFYEKLLAYRLLIEIKDKKRKNGLLVAPVIYNKKIPSIYGKAKEKYLPQLDDDKIKKYEEALKGAESKYEECVKIWYESSFDTVECKDGVIYFKRKSDDVEAIYKNYIIKTVLDAFAYIDNKTKSLVETYFALKDATQTST